jgi:hypothetical protein
MRLSPVGCVIMLEDRKYKATFSPRRSCRPPPPAAAARAASRGLDMPLSMGDAEASGFEGLGAARRKAGGDFKRHFTSRRGEIHRGGAYSAYGPTRAWASSKAKSSW